MDTAIGKTTARKGMMANITAFDLSEVDYHKPLAYRLNGTAGKYVLMLNEDTIFFGTRTELITMLVDAVNAVHETD